MRRSLWPAMAAWVGILCAPFPAMAEDAEGERFVFLHVIQLSAEPGSLGGDGPLRLALETARPAELAAVQPQGTVQDIRAGEIVVQLPAAPEAMQSGEPEEWTAASFVVDFDEPDVEALLQAGRERFGERRVTGRLAGLHARPHRGRDDRGLRRRVPGRAPRTGRLHGARSPFSPPSRGEKAPPRGS